MSSQLRSMFRFDSDSGAKRNPPGKTVDRLSPGVSIIVIAILSALSWVVLVAIVKAVLELL